MNPDVNKPVENPRLRELFDELKNADSSKAGELNEAIAEEIALNANLLAVFNVDAGDIEDIEEGTAVLKKDGEQSYLAVVDVRGDPDAVFRGIGNAAGPFLDKGMYIDMVPYAVPFGKRAATGEPIYRRKKGLFRK